MYYGKNVDKSCLLCVNSTLISVRNEMICSRKGFVTPEMKCCFFKYDPLKRPVFPKPVLPEFESEEFKI